MEDYLNDMEKPWIAAEPATPERESSVPENYDKIDGIGPQSVKELIDDVRLAEKEMKDPNQWDSLSNFMISFKQTHAAWFK